MTKVLKFSFAYVLYVSIVVSFDYFYMPWLAIRFRYLAVIPLYFSIFAISWIGLLLYRRFQDDVLLVEKVKEWINGESKNRTVRFLKSKIKSNPRIAFVAISIWWGPLHSYLYFKKNTDDNVTGVARSMGLGSLYCALFWGVIIDFAVAIWDTASGAIIGLYSRL